MEVAELARNKEAILLLKEKFAQVDSNQVRKQSFDQILFNEAALDSAVSVLSSMDNALLSDGKRLLQQMSKGNIPCGIWNAFSSRLNAMKEEIQNLIEDIQKQVQDEPTKLNPETLQEENTKLKKEIEQLRSAIKTENQILQCEKTVEELKRCESHCIRTFHAKFAKKESMEWDESLYEYGRHFSPF